jgi:hypothetical protein
LQRFGNADLTLQARVIFGEDLKVMVPPMDYEDLTTVAVNKSEFAVSLSVGRSSDVLDQKLFKGREVRGQDFEVLVSILLKEYLWGLSSEIESD